MAFRSLIIPPRENFKVEAIVDDEVLTFKFFNILHTIRKAATLEWAEFDIVVYNEDKVIYESKTPWMVPYVIHGFSDYTQTLSGLLQYCTHSRDIYHVNVVEDFFIVHINPSPTTQAELDLDWKNGF